MRARDNNAPTYYRQHVKILIVAPEWPPNVIGGGGIVFQRIAQHLARHGHRVTAAVGNYQNTSMWAGSRDHAESGVEVVELPLIPTPAFASWLATALPPVPRAMYTLHQLLKRDWDVVHLHGVGFPMIDYAAFVLRRTKRPYLFTIHGVPVSPLRRGSVPAFLMNWYLRQFTAKTVAGAAEVTAVSRAMFNNGVLPVAHGTVIYNGIDGRDIAKDDAPSRSVHTPMRVMSMSRLSHNKGLDIAIRAVRVLISRGFPVLYDLYGSDGGDKADLERLVRQNDLMDVVRFCGRFDPLTRNETLLRYDVCLVPSRVEAFGLVALEAQIAGVPVVASKREGLEEVLTQDSSILVESEDPESWADAITLLARDDERARIVAAGFQNASRFSWDVILPEYESKLRQAAMQVCERP